MGIATGCAQQASGLIDDVSAGAGCEVFARRLRYVPVRRRIAQGGGCASAVRLVLRPQVRGRPAGRRKFVPVFELAAGRLCGGDGERVCTVV